jgi:phosphate transport system substrate-binding protein
VNRGIPATGVPAAVLAATVLLTSVLVITVPATSTDAAPRGEIRIKGSDTMLLLVERWAQAFMMAHPGVVVEVEGGGTATGIRELIRGDVEIASASRPLRPEEARRLLERQGSLGYAVLVGRDALSVYLHPDNPVTDLSLVELRGIFTGEIRRWSEVGGRDARITVLTRNPASGTYFFFAQHVLGGGEYTRRARVLPTTAAIIDAVQADPDAVGYGGVGYVEGVRPCAVEGVAPTAENVRLGEYPISRYLYFYTAAPPEGLIKDFVDWVLGAEGQAIVREVGYVALYREDGSTSDPAPDPDPASPPAPLPEPPPSPPGR